METYWMSENELSTSRLSKVIIRQPVRQTGQKLYNGRFVGGHKWSGFVVPPCRSTTAYM